MVIVVVLPFAKLFIEESDVVADAVAVQELIKLLVINAVRALDFSVQMRRPRPNVHMANIAFFEVPVELRLKLCAIVGLHDEDAEWQPPTHFVDELDGCPLRARIKQLQHTNARAVVDRCELVEPPPRARDPLQELHVELESMARLRLFVPLPSCPIRAMLLIAGSRCRPRRVRMRCTVERAMVTGGIASGRP